MIYLPPKANHNKDYSVVKTSTGVPLQGGIVVFMGVW
jgi:hypothetical protein